MECKGLFIPSESASESEKDQTTSKREERINDKHQRQLSLSLGVNELMKQPININMLGTVAASFVFPCGQKRISVCSEVALH